MGDFDGHVYNGKEAFMPTFKPKAEPKIDKMVTEIVGKPIKVNNPELIKIIVERSKARGDTDEPDNLFKDPVFIEEIKKRL